MESALELRTLGKNDGPIVEKLFGKNGACGGCWCMYWHRPTHGKAWDAVKGEPNRRDFLRLIKQGKLKAMLAFRAGEAVGWCCYGPKLSFARLAKSSRLRRDGDEAAWAIVCLYLAAKARRQGIGTQLIAAAADAALAEGASELEGYPKDVAKGTTTAGAFIWTGTSGQYRKAGFSKIKRAEGLRPIYLRCA